MKTNDTAARAHRTHQPTARILAAIWAAAGAAFAIGCGATESTELPSSQFPSAELPSGSLPGSAAPGEAEAPASASAPVSNDELDPSQAIASLSLSDGAELRFFSHEDGSISMTEEGTASHSTMLGRPELSDATPLEVFWALAPASEALPEALLAHQAQLIAEGAAATDTTLERGWLARLPAPVREKSSACDDSIRQFVCQSGGSGFAAAPGCFDSVTGSVAWLDNAQPMRRYRTGFCSTGTVDVSITYGFSGPPNCNVFRILNGVKSGHFSNTNWHYAWNGTSGSTPRGYSNFVDHVSGAGFGWGVREQYHTSSSCTL